MDRLAKRLLQALRRQELLRAGDRVAVAVSGGADSVALLFLLEELRPELGIVLSVAHVNHKLRGPESDEDEIFTANLATRLGLECETTAAPVKGSGSGHARGTPGIEAAARQLRYEFFRGLAERGRVNKVATAHTLDDQAETVLLRIFRGTGIRGLAGIHPRLQFGGARASNKSAVEVIRPLLGFRRVELRQYLSSRSQPWREDSTNADSAFLRNRVRHRLLPLIIEEFGDAAIQHMAELAEIARAEEEYWAGEQIDAVKSSAGFDLRNLARPLAVQRRQVRAWIKANAPEAGISFPLIEEILELARGPAGKKLALPGEAGTVRRSRSDLMFEVAVRAAAVGYEYVLPVPGAVTVPELEATIESKIVEVETVPESERNNLLDPARVADSLTIRNWRPGDRFWPAHTARERKVKELLADLHATGAKKKLWPVAVDQKGSIVWMPGFAAPASFAPGNARAVCIRVSALPS
jgi:tRNA(Ile)-lysidine synthase